MAKFASDFVLVKLTRLVYVKNVFRVRFIIALYTVTWIVFFNTKIIIPV